MNSAVVATIPDVDSSHEDLRRAYNDTLTTNSTSVAVLTTAFTPLPRGERFFRSRFHERADDGEFATNSLGGVLGIEAGYEPLNEFRGRRDLFEGVKVVEELAMCERGNHGTGF
ncbi:hypothetical protein HBI71_036940 [Parastagonospora nodorum]|nr:hypothetical protein HBI71_036940 [Parastagonospora nodorum]